MLQAQALSTPNVPSKMRGRPCQSSTSTSHTQIQQRRKQIREAQRAYQSRQQSHLESLKARVAQLEDVVEQVGQVMGVFHDDYAAQEEVGEHIERAEMSTSPARGCEFHGKINKVLSEPYQSTHGPSDKSPSGSLTSNFWCLFFNSTNPILPPIQKTTPSLDTPTHPPFNTTNQTIQYTTTPFTQKLLRACAESGHRYLTNPTVTDAQMWPEFGLMLEYLPRQEIISYFERALNTSPCNPVLDGQFPFISLGDAGVHFSSGSRGMQNLFPFQETNGVRVISSEEEWFDVKDVEGYLVDRGIRLVGCYDLASYTGDGSSLVVSGQVLPDNMVAVLDESTLINGLSRLCICLGCVAGFRRRDVESLIWQNVRWALD